MMPVVSGPNPPHKNYQEKKNGRVREKTMHTFKTLIQHWGWIPRNASLGLVTAPPWKLIKKIFKKSYKSLHFNVGIARSKWKIEQQAGKAESSYFKQWFEESISYLPHLHMHSFNPELCSRCEPVCTSPDSSTGGKPAVQLCKDGTNPSGRCQFCSALLYMEKQKVSVSPAVVLQPDGLGSFSSHPCVVFWEYSSLFCHVHQKRRTTFLNVVTMDFSEVIFTTSEFKVGGKTR